MKKIAVLLLLVILCRSFGSCGLDKNLPDKVTIDEKEYTCAFVATLYPLQDGFRDTDAQEIEIAGVSYYQYTSASFDCYIAYDLDAEPSVYFESKRYDDAVSFYNSAENFNYFCLLGNVHDESEQEICTIPNVDSLMFDQLIDFAKENDYNPLTSDNDEDGLKSVPIPDTDNWMAHEIHIYKVSKDDAFTTLQGYTFLLLDNHFYLLYQYDFSNETAPVMRLKEIPETISHYFCNLMDNIPSKRAVNQ